MVTYSLAGHSQLGEVARDRPQEAQAQHASRLHTRPRDHRTALSCMFRGPPPCPDNLLPPRPASILRPTTWGRCHWVWRDEAIGNAVRDWGAFGPLGQVKSALRLLGPSAHLVDVGSNVGLVSAAALALGHNVTCFEAEKGNAALLRATLALNNWTARAAVVERAVVEDSQRTRTVHFQRWNPRNRGGSRVVRRGGSQVPTTHLDLWASRVAPQGTPVVMKLDIEGCEHSAIKGALRKMLPRVQVVITEISPRAMIACGGNASRYVKLLQRHGFTVVKGHGRRGAAALQRAIRDAELSGSILDATFLRPPTTIAARLRQMLWRSDR